MKQITGVENTVASVRFKASFTIEAAFVMPVVIGVVLLLLEYSMILHDNVVIMSIVNEEAAFAAGRLKGKEDEKYDFKMLSHQRLFFGDTDSIVITAQRSIADKAGKALLFSELKEAEVKKTMTGCVVSTVIGYRRVPPLLRSLISEKYEASVSTYDRESKTRLSTVLFDTIGGIIP